MGAPLLDDPLGPEAVEFGLRDLQDLLARLIDLPEVPGRVVSCYLRLYPEDRRNQAYLRWIKERVSACQASLPATLPHADRESLKRDLVRILARVEDPEQLPAAKGIALFACEEVNLFAEAPLPDIPRSRLMISSSPWLADLIRLKDQYLPIVVLALDRRHARFFEVTPWKVTETACVPAIATPAGKYHEDRGDSPGWGERSYHARMQEEQHRLHLRVLEELEQRCGNSTHGFVLAGAPKQVAAFPRLLPPTLRARLLGVTRLNPVHATKATVERIARTSARQYELRAMVKLVADFKEQIGHHLATNDLGETLRALNQGQVRELIVASDAQIRGFRCLDDGRLVVRRTECGAVGGEPIGDLIDEAMQLALRQDVPIACVPAGVRTEEIAPLAATLRYR